MGLCGSNIVNLIAQQLLKPLNHSLPAEPREEHLARAAGPVLRPRQPLHGAVRRLDGRHRLAQRQGRARTSPAWTCRGTSSGSRRRTRARSGILDDKRDALSMPMQRDAMRKGVRPDLNTEDPAIDRQGAARPRPSSARICNIKVTITDYQTLPEGKTVLHHSWSGDLLGAAFYYLPKGVPPSVLSFWGPDKNGVVQNDFFCIGAVGEEPGARARVHQLHARREERLRQLRQLQRLHAAAEDDRRRGADQARADPGARSSRRSSGPTSSPCNQELLQLSVEGERYWDKAWSKFKAG